MAEEQDPSYLLGLAIIRNDPRGQEKGLAAGADPNPPVWDGVHTPLYWAAERGRWEFIEPLVRAGARVSAEVGFETTSLHLAAGRPEVVRVLLTADPGPVINMFDAGGRTPLYDAFDAESTRLLLAAGADATLQTSYGSYTALHYVAMGRDVERVRLLLEAGADPTCPEAYYGSTTPLDLARRNPHPEGPAILKLCEAAAEVVKAKAIRMKHARAKPKRR